MAQKYIKTKSSEYLFPDARYAKEDGGLSLLQSGDKRSLQKTVQSYLWTKKVI